jgi:hypothetical protein
MKYGISAFIILLAFSTNTVCYSQSKEAVFSKMEKVFNKANGISIDGHKVLNQVINEKVMKRDMLSDGKNGTITATDLDWQSFDFSVIEQKDNADISIVVISFEKELEFSVYQNNKVVDKQSLDEFELVINTADEKTIRGLFTELKTYTYPPLVKLKAAGKEELISFLTKSLNKAIEDGYEELKSVNECEIVFSYEGEEFILPTKNVRIHEKESLGKYTICYGTQKSLIKIKKRDSTIQSQAVEHPDIELDFSDTEEGDLLTVFAIKWLSTYCKS